MAAAALGNLISDVAGVGLAHYVEVLVNKAGVKHPVLTLEQLESSKVTYFSFVQIVMKCVYLLLILGKMDDESCTRHGIIGWLPDWHVPSYFLRLEEI